MLQLACNSRLLSDGDEWSMVQSAHGDEGGERGQAPKFSPHSSGTCLISAAAFWKVSYDTCISSLMQAYDAAWSRLGGWRAEK